MMKAAIFYGKNDIRVGEKEIRAPVKDEVVVKIAYCGICGTDLHIFHGDEGSAVTVPPFVLGHEMSGTVVQIGEGVTRFSVGDRVCIDPNSYCGECYYCRSSMEHFCSEMMGVGTTVDGGFAEYCTLPAKMVLHIPDSLSLKAAAFSEPLACCLHGIDLTKITVGSRVLVIGGGTIGLLMVQLSKLAGASWITLVEPDPEKRKLSESMGADEVYEDGESLLKALKEDPQKRVDRVIECVGKTETISCALEAASKGATVMMFGLTPPKAELTIRPFEIFKKELNITASFVNPLTQARAVELLASGRISVEGLISAEIPLEKLSEALTEPKYRLMKKILVKI